MIFVPISCGEIAVDGGFDYFKVCYPKISPQTIKLEIDATKQELYNDWNKRIDKFGIIKSK